MRMSLIAPTGPEPERASEEFDNSAEAFDISSEEFAKVAFPTIGTGVGAMSWG